MLTIKYIGYFVYSFHETFGGAERRAFGFEERFNKYCKEHSIDVRIKRVMFDEELRTVDAMIFYGAHYKNHPAVTYVKNKHNMKVILSSIFVKNGPGLLYKILSKLERPKTTQRMTYEILLQSDYIFAATNFEKNLIVRTFEIEDRKIEVLPNLIDENDILNQIDDMLKLPIDDEVIRQSYICAGRIEPVKNQLILYGINIPVIFIGDCNHEYKEYCNRFNQMIRENNYFTYIKGVERRVLLNIIKRSKGLIMPSLFETFGRVALEAAILGKPLIISDIPTTKEYLEGYRKVLYFNPRSRKELKKAINETEKLNNTDETPSFSFCYSKGIEKYVDYFKRIVGG